MRSLCLFLQIQSNNDTISSVSTINNPVLLHKTQKENLMNPYLRNLEKIEFLITYACTGKCKHCSEGDHSLSGVQIDPEKAADAVRKIAEQYWIRTVMTFGGEPLLYPEAVYQIHKAAKELGIPKRQVITNGYFSRNPDRIAEVAEGLLQSGVNDILLSVDAFHQETIPLEPVRIFASEIKKRSVSLRMQPAWLVSAADNNPYNLRTRELLQWFHGQGIEENQGNVIFPEGNAKKYLAEYFCGEKIANPYRENPYDVKCVSFEPDGSVFGGNLYCADILDILQEYQPK